MIVDEIKALSELITQVRLDIRELTTEVRSLKDLRGEVDGVKASIIEFEQRIKSAQHRLTDLETDVEKLKEGQNWLPKLIATSVITTVLGGGIGIAIAQAVGS